MPSFIDQILYGGKPGVTDFLSPLGGGLENNRTPGINPGAPLPEPLAEPIKTGGKSRLGGLDKLLSNPMVLNILAQQGKSLTPGPGPLGVIGRAGLATQQQKQQESQAALQQKLIESQIGLNRAKTAGELSGGSATALSDIGKLGIDLQNGRISQAVYDAKVNQVIAESVNDRFDNTQKLRAEFLQQTSPIGQSLQSLSAAQSLVAQGGNPIGDLAAFISTIKSIDNSTVREGELAAFESVQGFMRQLENQVAKAKGEGYTDTLRRDIADTIDKLQKPLNELLDKKRTFYSKEAGKFELDPESITGQPFAEVGGLVIPPAGADSRIDPAAPSVAPGPLVPGAKVLGQ